MHVQGSRGCTVSLFLVVLALLLCESFSTCPSILQTRKLQSQRRVPDVDAELWDLLLDDDAAYNSMIRCPIGEALVERAQKYSRCGPGGITCLNGGQCIVGKCRCVEPFAGRDCRFNVSQVPTNLPHGEVEALVELFDGFGGGEDWCVSYNWVTNIDPCPLFNSTSLTFTMGPLSCQNDLEEGWYGVFCDPRGTHVTELHLNRNVLVGTIADVFDRLPNMKFIDISENFVGGTIPRSFLDIHLVEIKLDQLYLTGSPLDSSLLPSVSHYQFSKNCLVGTFPALSANLTELIGKFNYLNGTILNEPVYNHLKQCDMEKNRFTGYFPVALYESLTEIDRFNIHGADLSCPVPPALKLMPCLNVSYVLHSTTPSEILIGAGGYLVIEGDFKDMAPDFVVYGNIHLEMYLGPGIVLYAPALSSLSDNSLVFEIPIRTNPGNATLTLMQRHDDYGEDVYYRWVDDVLFFRYVKCASGEYSPQYNMTVDYTEWESFDDLLPPEVTCEICPPGYFCDGVSPSPCPLGTYSPQPGQSASSGCSQCPVFSSTSSEGSTSRGDCICQDNWYGDLNDASAVCMECPEGGVCTDGVLRAQPGYFYVSSTDTVVKCDTASYCRGSHSVIHFHGEETTEPDPDSAEGDGVVLEELAGDDGSGGSGGGPSFWSLLSTLTGEFGAAEEEKPSEAFHSVGQRNGKASAAASTWTRRSGRRDSSGVFSEENTDSESSSAYASTWTCSWAGVADNCCADHHQGWLCSTCEADHSIIGTGCTSCPPPLVNGLLIALYTICWLGIMFLMVFASINSRSNATFTVVLKICSNFLQINALILLSYETLSSALRTMLKIEESSATPSVELPFFTCLIQERDGTAQYVEFLFTMALPWILLALTAGMLVIRQRYLVYHRMLLPSSSDELGRTNRSLANIFILTAVVIFFNMYTVLINTIFELFACRDDVGDGQDHLRADLSIICTDEQHKSWQIAGIVFMVVYGVLCPAVLALWLYRSRKAVDSEDFAVRFGFLVRGFREECVYWECGVIMLRKFIITFIVNFIVSPDVRGCAFAATILAFLVLHSAKKPFSKECGWVRHLETASLIATEGMVMIVMLLDDMDDPDSLWSVVLALVLGLINAVFLVLFGCLIMEQFLLLVRRRGFVRLEKVLDYLDSSFKTTRARIRTPSVSPLRTVTTTIKLPMGFLRSSREVELATSLRSDMSQSSSESSDSVGVAQRNLTRCSSRR
eukprot:Rmarinus@m.24106